MKVTQVAILHLFLKRGVGWYAAALTSLPLHLTRLTPQVFYILYESAAGYALFEVKDAEEIAALAEKVQKSLSDFKRVAKLLALKAFRPFTSAEIGLENINDVSEGAPRALPLRALFASDPALGPARASPSPWLFPFFAAPKS